ncbi:glycosyltransferase [Winogradskyella sp. 3972H.M.0a.05]|uniref:glycosyltransferase family 4 protein n=1 Tax=Winogradskyella sp. 3972H.M.0a.05 TaxID=2950277 RepID=UPI003398998B
MSKRLKIAIFSGAIPSSTFVEHLINNISDYHNVYLFGVVNKKTVYKNNSVKQIVTPKRHFKNLLISLVRTFQLLFKAPKDLLIVLRKALSYPVHYDKWIWYTKYLPIALHRPDILHLQWARDLNFYYFFQEELNINLIVGLRGAHINYSPIVEERIANLYRKTFPQIQNFHAVSNAIAKEAQQYGADANNIRVIHSPIQTETFQYFKKREASNDEEFNIISVGRFHWVKGMTYAIDACRILKERGFKFHFHFYATNAIDEETLFKIHQFDLQDHITVHRSVAQKELFSKMKSADVLLLTSLAEGIANVVLEAMAIGVPVISTDCGGMSEVVINNTTGKLIPKRDAEAIAEAITALSRQDDKETEKTINSAHDLVQEQFYSEDVIGQFKDFYENAVANNI